MLDIAAETRIDRRPAMIICAYDPDDTRWDPVEDLSGTPWSPSGARTLAVAAQSPEQLVEVLSGHLRDTDCRALLLIGKNHSSDAFRVQMRAENRALGGGPKLVETGPAIARATAPVAKMVRALTDVGLAADASSESEDDAGSYLLYSLLTTLPDDVDVPAIGLLRTPVDADKDAVQRGVKAAAASIARHLSPLARSRAV